MMEYLGHGVARIFFMLELLLGTIAFFLPLAKRKGFWLRVILGAAGCRVLCLFSLPSGGELPIYLLGAAVFVFLCCDVSPQDALYCATCGYAAQHFGYSLREILRLMGWVYSAEVYDLYLPDMLKSTAITLCVSICFFWIFARRMADGKRYNMDTRRALLSVLTVLAIVVVLSKAAESSYKAGMEQLYLICHLYAMFCCVFILWIQTSGILHSKLERELTLQQQLRDQQREQYTLTRENIEIINRKCHDLKHQMSALRSIVPEAQREAYMKEVERSIQIYDSTLQTGNEVLDTILTEKSLYCEAHQTVMTCVADGSQLAFMDSIDVYAIFGNALDNAIESVLRLSDPQQRVITVSVWARSGLMLFQFENYYEGTLEFRDGLPVTTKNHADYHGYGIKSIRETAKKYGGQMTLHTENNLFLLRVSIPIPS